MSSDVCAGKVMSHLEAYLASEERKHGDEVAPLLAGFTSCVLWLRAPTCKMSTEFCLVLHLTRLPERLSEHTALVLVGEEQTPSCNALERLSLHVQMRNLIEVHQMLACPHTTSHGLLSSSTGSLDLQRAVFSIMLMDTVSVMQKGCAHVSQHLGVILRDAPV